MTEPTENVTDLFGSDIHAARINWEDDIWNVTGGVICPVCDRRGKVYARVFGYPMAKTLIWVYCAAQNQLTDWIHAPSLGTRSVLTSNNLGHVKKFGLLESMPADPDGKKKHSGIYRVTELGKRVVNREIKIPQYIFTYNDELIEARGEIENVSIEQALQSGGFSFAETMEAAIKATRPLKVVT